MKKKLIYTTCITFLCYTAVGQNGEYLPANIDLHHPGINPFEPSKWEKVFEDNFDDDGPPNPALWENVSNYAEPPDKVVSVYKSENVWIQNGVCGITIKEDNVQYNGTTYYYSSGEIRSRSTHADPREKIIFERGMFEAEIKMSGAYWAHNNFWVLSGPKGGELDICEVRCSNGREKVPMSVHNYYTCGSLTHECNLVRPVPFRVDEGFHIYTCIWDEYYIYFYIDHHLVMRVDKFEYYTSNTNSQKSNFHVENNQYKTAAGYYWLTDCFYPINSKGDVRLHVNVDKQPRYTTDLFLNLRWGEIFKVRKHLTKQNTGLPSKMEINWVRVYQRPRCDKNLYLTNSRLLPYHDYEGKEIIMGTHETQNVDPSKRTWKNIAKPWGGDSRISGKYIAESITLTPNFTCHPEFVDATPCISDDNLFDESNYTTHGLSNTWLDGEGNDIFDNSVQPSVTIFEAKLCTPITQSQEEEIENGYIMPEIPEWDTTYTSEDTFDCNDLDTAYIDSVLYDLYISGDTALADSIIGFIVDTLGCEYWGYGGGGQSKPGRRSDGSPAVQYRTAKNKMFIARIRIYPNPTTSTFHIEMPQRGSYSLRVMNILGTTVYEGKMADEQRKSIQLDNNLPPGNYTIHISGDGLRHVERITLTK